MELRKLKSYYKAYKALAKENAALVYKFKQIRREKRLLGFKAAGNWTKQDEKTLKHYEAQARHYLAEAKKLKARINAAS